MRLRFLGVWDDWIRCEDFGILDFGVGLGGGFALWRGRAPAGRSLRWWRRRKGGFGSRMGWLWTCLGGGPSIQSAKNSKSHRVRTGSQKHVCRICCPD